jgi:type IV pilus assembly protein PilW
MKARSTHTATMRLIPGAPLSRRLQRGMTLVELMVALLLGMVTTYFIAQVFAVAEGQKRTATFGSDAQVNGAVALYTLKRHVQASGYGLTAVTEGLGCAIRGEYGTAGSTAAAPAMNLAPIVIAPSVSASAPSDAITVLSSSKSNSATVAYVSETHPNNTNFFPVRSSFGVAVGDVMLAIPKAWDANRHCTLFTVAEDPGSPDTTLSMTRIPHVAGGTASWNNVNPTTVFPAAGYEQGASLVNFGTVKRLVFGVNQENLQVVTWTQAGIGNAEQLQTGVVLLRALYGRDTNGDGVVDTYDTTTPVTAADWGRVLAVRVAVVARSGQYEKDEVTAAAPTWNVGSDVAVSYVDAPGNAATVCAAGASNCELPLTLSHLNSWKHYRYKVFDTVIPLRNILWNLGT